MIYSSMCEMEHPKKTMGLRKPKQSKAKGRMEKLCVPGPAIHHHHRLRGDGPLIETG